MAIISYPKIIKAYHSVHKYLRLPNALLGIIKYVANHTNILILAFNIYPVFSNQSWHSFLLHSKHTIYFIS